jgi:hypothetical protein
MELSKTQTEILEAIRRKMQRGDIRDISTMTKFTREYVGKCLNSDADFFNQTIVEAAIKIISDREQKATQLLKSLSAA